MDTGISFLLFILIVQFAGCNQSNESVMDNKGPLNSEYAYKLAEAYAEYKNLNLQERIRVQNEERFRVDFNSIDMSYIEEDKIIIIRSCVERHSYPPLPTLLEMIDDLQVEFEKDLQDAKFEWDSSALEVDMYDPHRFNMIWVLSVAMPADEFCTKLDELHLRAKSWGNKHYDAVLKKAVETKVK